MDKAGYIKQLKQLIKKYHPDLCTDEYLEERYNEITKKLVGLLNKFKESELPETKEQDYKYYKLGIKYYKNIHPDRFFKNRSNNSYETRTYEELAVILNNIFLSFKLSESYFNKLIKEYPGSSWCGDAAEKIKLLNKLYKRYENIVLDENKITNYSQFVSDMGLKFI